MLANHQVAIISRGLGYMMVSALFLYLINNYLVYWQDMPGTFGLMSHYGFAGLDKLDPPLSDEQISQGWIQFVFYLSILILSLAYALNTRTRSLLQDSVRLATLAA